MATILQICQGIADGAGFSRPTSLVGSNDEIAKRLLQAAKREGRSLARRCHWQRMQKVNTITLVSGDNDYALPADLDYIIDDTVWDRANDWQLPGPLTSQEWEELENGIVTVLPRFHWQLRSNEFFIFPTPGAGDDGNVISFRYMSKYWCASSVGVEQSTIAADTDILLLDEDVFQLGVEWRFLRSLGEVYAEEFAEYERELSQRIARDKPGKLLSQQLFKSNQSNLPETGYGS